jgi:hypothetical protein
MRARLEKQARRSLQAVHAFHSLPDESLQGDRDRSLLAGQQNRVDQGLELLAGKSTGQAEASTC